MEKKQPQHTSSIDLKGLFCGVISGGTSNLILHPLDSIKTRIQAEGRGQKATARSQFGLWNTVLFTSNLLKQQDGGGWRVLYQGLGSSVVGAGASWGLYFLIYNSSKNYFMNRRNLDSQGTAEEEAEDFEGNNNENTRGVITRGHELPTSLLLASSLNAGLLTTTVTHPIWLVKTRLQLQNNRALTAAAASSGGANAVLYRGAMDCFFKVLRNEGISKGLYLGFVPSLFLISHGAIHFVLYDSMKDWYLKQRLHRRRQQAGATSSQSEANVQSDEESYQLSSMEALIMAGSSKSIAALTTYPFQVIKTRLQDTRNNMKLPNEMRPPNFVHYNGMFDAIVKMYRTEGAFSFFRGIVPHVVRVTPSGAITLTIYEFVSNIISKYEGNSS